MRRLTMNPYGPPTNVPHGFGYPRPPFAPSMMSFGPPRMQVPPRIPHFEVPLETPAEDQESMEEAVPSEASSSVNQMRVYPTRLQTFDQYVCEQEFPRCEADDALGNALLTRNQQITPTTNEQTAITNLMSRIKNALEQIAAIDAVPSVKIDEYREVGSYKKGTMLSKHNVADLVVMFRTLPAPETVKQLGMKIVELLKAGGQPNEVFGVVPRDFGCEIADTHAVLRILVAISVDQIEKLNPDLHLSADVIQKNLSALRHAYWFDEHAGQPAIKILVRLIKDIKSRTSGFAALDVWTIELLCHYCITCTSDRQQLPLVHAFRRFFQMISSGFLLHTSVAVADPCDQMRRINHGFDPIEADTICRTAQFITRLLIHEKYDRLMATNKNMVKDVALENETDPTLNIAPLKAAYNRDLIVNHPPSDRFYSRIQI
ncbi:hypothetical protein M3Y98_00130800 [Aphelenchoides besseyi]|nr:hypothetical protein M3Y98_00130800 [Aphelenchoides besseyi]